MSGSVVVGSPSPVLRALLHLPMKRKVVPAPSPRNRPSPNMGVLALERPPLPAEPCGRSEPSSSAVVVRQPVNLLGEALGLGVRAAAGSRLSRGRSVGAAGGGSDPLAGTPVASVPTDWAPKRCLTITSTRPLDWCAALSASSEGEAMRLSGAADAASLVRPGAAHAYASSPTEPRDMVTEQAYTVRLRAALLSWRHPAQRLPPLVSRQLADAELGPAEVAYSRGLRENWQVRAARARIPPPLIPHP